MEKQMTIDAGNKGVAETTNKVMCAMNSAMEIIRKYYSDVLERDITIHQTIMLLKAQAAFFATIMPADYSLTLRAMACLWFLHTLKECRKEL